MLVQKMGILVTTFDVCHVALTEKNATFSESIQIYSFQSFAISLFHLLPTAYIVREGK